MDTEVTQVNNIKKAEFLKRFKNPKIMGNVAKACHKTGISRTTFYDWMKEDEDFKALIESIKSDMCDVAEGELYTRGMKRDTTALIFWLKNRHPDYKENALVQVNTQNNTLQLTDEQLKRIFQD